MDRCSPTQLPGRGAAGGTATITLAVCVENWLSASLISLLLCA